MSLADLFPGFDSRTVAVGDVKLFCRIGGEGPPVVLLHGYPQTHVQWHRVAPALARTHRLILPDLRGYGWSSVPKPDAAHEGMSKRTIAADIVALMEELGHVRFAVVGHDRGGRVGYRLALDHPGRVTRLAVLDIVPTFTMWERMDRALALKVYHWLFLAQPKPLPEMLIGPQARHYLEHTLASWTKSGDLSAFDARALEHYRAFYEVPERLAACCEDYRAGATLDLEHDRADRAAGRRIDVPVFALWGSHGIPADSSPLAVWRDWAVDVDGEAIDAGHFLPEENPEATAAALARFLGDAP